MKRSTFEKAAKGMIAALGILTAAYLVSLITLLISGMKPDVFVKRSDNAESDPSALSSRLDRTPDYGQSYINSMIFLGDRTVSAMASADSDLAKQIWSGESGDLSLDFSVDTATVVFPESGESLSVSAAVARKKPDYLLITLGANNGVSYCNEEKFKEYYGKLITAITESSPDTKIILQSVFPVSKDHEKQDPTLTNRKIDEANGWIESLAEEMGVRYLHTASALKNDGGALDPAYDSGDGITLNASGYAKVLDYVRSHGYK